MVYFIKYMSVFALGLLHFTSVAQVGNPAPDFTVTDTHGEEHNLYDYLEDGKVVVLDFFYTTCGPCQFYSPQVNLAYEKYGCNNAEVFFMAIDWGDTDAEVLAYDDEYMIEYPSISGTEGGGNEVVNLYNVSGFPTFYVIDSTKKIIDQIDPPTLQVFDFRFGMHDISPADCNVTTVSEAIFNDRLQLFPNPIASGELFIEVPKNLTGATNISIYNLFGQIIEQRQVNVNQNTISLFIEELNSGVYFVEIIALNNSKKYSGKFQKL